MFIRTASIKAQILVAYAMLVLPLALLSYSTLTTHTSFTQGMQQTIVQDAVLTTTATLQRDVMDMQRNVLIFKGTASDGAVTNVQKTYAAISQTMAQLQGNPLLISQQDALAGMQQHLTDYKTNFDVVVDYRSQRLALVTSYLGAQTQNLHLLVDTLALPPLLRSKVLVQIEAARGDSLAFLTNSNYDFVEQFKVAMHELDTLLANAPAATPLVAALRQYKKDFLLVVNLTRNYVFLINVVMAGSAQEILFYADTLAVFAKDYTFKQQQKMAHAVAQQRTFIVALLCLGLAIAVFVPLYFFRLISQPIARITGVFNQLAQGDLVAKIPGGERTDEIGLLAKAANVFKAKNEQTTLLLAQAEQSVEIEKQLNKDLLEAKDRAEKALSVKSDFLANMSHELRTPLNAVIGYTVRLLRTSETFTPRELSALNTIERNGKHLLAMINDVLDLSKLEASKLELKLAPVDVYVLCQEVVEQLSASCEEKGLTFIAPLPAVPPIVIATDSLRLTQILINLVSNAIKYTEQGSVRLEIETDADAQQVRVAVADTGIGIKSEDCSRLFKRFEQCDDGSRYKIGHGTGLGLAIVDNLARLLGGMVEVKSEQGKGSCFTLVLPWVIREC